MHVTRAWNRELTDQITQTFEQRTKISDNTDIEQKADVSGNTDIEQRVDTSDNTGIVKLKKIRKGAEAVCLLLAISVLTAVSIFVKSANDVNGKG